MTERPEDTPEEASADLVEPPEDAKATEPDIEPGAADVEPDEPVTEDGEPEDDEREPEPEPVVAGAGAVGVGGGRKRRTPPGPTPRAPTVSEIAVHMTDNSSKVFVIAAVVVFVGILLYGMLAGRGGLLSPEKTPRPSASATAPASVAPSASSSAGPSASPAASGSAAPS